MAIRVLPFLVRVASLVLGYIWPAYGSVQAIESNGSEDDTHWLIYWLLFAILNIVESVAWPLLQWVPLYSYAKTALLAWLVLPQTKGALWVYEALLAPGLAKAREAVHRSPALRQALEKVDRTAAAPARSDAENEAQTHARRGRLGEVLKDLSTAFDSDLARIQAMTEPKARARAEAGFDKDVSRLGKVAASRGSASAKKTG